MATLPSLQSFPFRLLLPQTFLPPIFLSCPMRGLILSYTCLILILYVILPPVYWRWSPRGPYLYCWSFWLRSHLFTPENFPLLGSLGLPRVPHTHTPGTLVEYFHLFSWPSWSHSCLSPCLIQSPAPQSSHTPLSPCSATSYGRTKSCGITKMILNRVVSQSLT